MERLRLVPVSPPAFQVAPWLRIEQRGSVALIKALPESLRSELVAQREVSSIGIMFKVLRVYQPGGLGERTTLLKQLVDQKVPSPLSDWMLALRSWRRWLTRVQELGIQPPDPVLLLSTLDRFEAFSSFQNPCWRKVRLCSMGVPPYLSRSPSRCQCQQGGPCEERRKT